MKVLLINNYAPAIKKAWETQGFAVFDEKLVLERIQLEELYNVLQVHVNQEHISYVYGVNFYPDLAEVCYRLGLVYISRMLDCPWAALGAKTARYPTNRMVVFDLKEYESLLARGIDQVYYLPLATDVEHFERVVHEECQNKERYAHDVAFVGNLYTDAKHSLFDQINYLPPYVGGYLEAAIAVQRKLWGVDIFREIVNGSLWKEINKYVHWELDDEFEDGTELTMFWDMLGQKATQLDRKEMCSYLARHFDFALYTASDTSFDKEILNLGFVVYLTEMPHVFHNSKININITLRSITSGIPLRVFDVLACEGFLLTNYQPEIAEYFVDGEELVMYDSLQDMYEKISYYLEHEEERNRIAHAGYLKVKEQFNNRKEIEQIVRILEEL